ncbi:ABC transporter permease [Nocardiopsis rhodophaea]|uniref:ABC transporter permease n=1 Tax=Nocardiopsis rhodophaea TaxID=280238 RepID=A0ABN2T1V2_9ACTN
MSASSTLLPIGPPLFAAIVLATLIAAALAALARMGHGAAVLRAGARAVVQLGAVSLIITAVVTSGPLTLLYVAVMLGVAGFTAGRRFTTRRCAVLAVVPIAVAVVPFLGVLLAAGLVRTVGLVLIPISGILIGGGLTATSLAGRRAMDELAARKGEVEAALSLGMSPRDAALEICRPAAVSALIPALDQTRTVGLVTLPGAFVGMLMGGASPVDAGAVQLFVLTGLLLVEVIAIVGCLEMFARGVFPPREAR